MIRFRDPNPYILISAAKAAAVRAGWRKPMPVVVTLNGGRSWRTNLMPVGNGGFYLYLHGSMRKESATRVGDRIRIALVFDRGYRNGPQHPIPPWFQEGLNGDPAAAKNWAALPPSRRKELLRYFVRLRSESARRRNLARALRVLSGSPGRFMGRAWSEGR